jgi:predicted TPR repeat methyltransferase
MPVSDKEGKDQIKEWIINISSNVDHVLDIGCGAGTYYKLFGKKKGKRPLQHSFWSGLEAWNPYIEKYKLHEMYNKIYCQDARTFDFNNIEFVDLAFAGDVLEHMTKKEAIDLVHSLFENCKRLIISIPIIYYPQDALEDNPFEIHIKDDYSHSEILESFPYIKKYWTGNTIGVYYLEK